MPEIPERIAAGEGARGAQSLYMTGTMKLRKHARVGDPQALD
jgi:hypothetical protein